jgi:hypothetical protein
MYALAVAFTDETDSIYCLEHPIPWRPDEGIWFDHPVAEDTTARYGVIATAHIEVLTATGLIDLAVPVPVE